MASKVDQLRALRESSLGGRRPPSGPCTAAEARALFARILSGVTAVYKLVEEAHDRGAWKALGYTSWAECAAAELNISKSRAFQLLTQGRVVGALSAAASTSVELNESQARAIAPQLEKAIAETKELVDAGVPAQEAVVRVATAARSSAKAARVAKRPACTDPDCPCVCHG